MKIQLDYRILLSVITMLLTIPPIYAQQWGQDQKVISPEKDRFEYFGSSVAYDDGVLAVGVPDNLFMGSKVLIYEENSNADSFQYLETLTPIEITKGDAFGYSIDIQGEYMIVGAPFDLVENTKDTFDAGAAYIFKRNSLNRWEKTQKIIPDNRQPISLFGFGSHVKISGNYAFISAPRDNKFVQQDTIEDVGSVYVYKRENNSETWIFVDLIEPEDYTHIWFGDDFDVHMDTIVISSWGYFHTYIKSSDSEEWVFDTYFEGEIFDNFGTSISYNGKFIFVGAPSKDYDAICCTGAVHCYSKNTNGTWIESQVLYPPDKIVNMGFSTSIMSTNSILIVTAPYEEVDFANRSLYEAGAVYTFQYNSSNGQWYETDKILSCDLEEEDEFGTSVTFTGSDVIVGAPYEDEGVGKDPPQDPFGYNDGGSVYVFKPCQAQNTSVQQAEHTLTAEATNVSYQWVNCDNDYTPVDGATEQSFSPAESGSYAVMVTTDNDCTDTSDCFMVTATSIVESTYGHEIEVYPNPAKEDVIFDLKELKSTIQLKVLNMQGQVLDSKNYKGAQTIHYKLDVPLGVYWFHITSGKGESAYLKVVKL